MADSEGGSEQDDVSFLRTVSTIPPWESLRLTWDARREGFAGYSRLSGGQEEGCCRDRARDRDCEAHSEIRGTRLLDGTRLVAVSRSVKERELKRDIEGYWERLFTVADNRRCWG
jgi:hypothetical protein